MSESEKLSRIGVWKNQRDEFIKWVFPKLQAELDAAIDENHMAGVPVASVERISDPEGYANYRELFYYAENIYQQLGFTVVRQQLNNSYFDRESARTVQATEHRFELFCSWEADK
jgi:hypothetical protein